MKNFHQTVKEDSFPPWAPISENNTTSLSSTTKVSHSRRSPAERTRLLAARKRTYNQAPPNSTDSPRATSGQLLTLSFVAMVIFGLGNKIFGKLETLPMQNYPLFQSLLSSFVYIPLSFAYVIPMMHLNPKQFEESRKIPQYQFAIMGILDGISGLMQTFATNYISSGSLIILLTQAAIPVSMAISKTFLDAKYSKMQYAGALVVLIGLGCVLIPNFQKENASNTSHNQLLWAAVMVVSCVPMCLSSVYKEKTLGEREVDVVWLNGWVAIYQFLISLPMAFPSAAASNIAVSQLGENLKNGFSCYLGHDSVLQSSSILPADHCSTAPLFVNVYLGFNVVYNILIIMILKYGSANLLYLALTIMVPLGNIAFSLDFVPGHQSLRSTDIAGLTIIMSGLVAYRFADKFWDNITKRRGLAFTEDEDSARVTRHAMRYFSLNAVEAMQPMIEPYIQLVNQSLFKSPQQIRESYLSRLGLYSSPVTSRSPVQP